MNLYQANAQWSTRPPDERFPSLDALVEATAAYQASAVERTVPYRDLVVDSRGDDIILRGPQGGTAVLTNWAFGQLAARAEAPASYLRTLPAPLAVENLTHGLTRRAEAGDDAALLLHRNGGLVVRALNSPKYQRIWNVDVARRLQALAQRGPWQPAPAAYDGSRGLYASDHDMFAFLVDNDRRIFEHAPSGGLSRGFFVGNSEVGASAFWLLSYLYDYTCGNHIVWGAREVKEVRINHVGDADRKAASFLAKVREYAESSASDDEARITRARSFLLGDDKDTVLDAVFRLRLPVLSQRLLGQAYDLAATDRGREWYGDPRTAWGLTSGLTELARDLPYADERVAVERAAGKVLDAVVF